MILTGDIGGTKTRLALWENKKLRKEERYASKEYPDLFTIIQDFLQKETVSLQAACFGIAGPVKDQVSHVTNLPWVVDAKNLSKKLQLSHVYLLNDLEANAYGIEFIPSNETIVFQEGEKNEGNRALIAAGTGLGEAGLYWDGKMYRPFACEGGHTDFGPRNEIEIDLLLFLRKKYSHVSYERILSGSGIYILYQFFLEREKDKELPEMQKQFKENDPAKVISEHAENKSCPICVKAIELFSSIYGAEAGNLALKILSWGGLYIDGGIAPKIFRFVKKEIFLQSFLEKGRFAEMLSKFPVKLIINERTALLGSLGYALKKINKEL